jgi:Zn-dependent metalloprotease
VAIALGGKAWERAGKIWYRTLIDKIQPLTNFAECAGMTYEVAGNLYGQGSAEQKAVKAGWAAVGIPIGAPLARAAGAR